MEKTKMNNSLKEIVYKISFWYGILYFLFSLASIPALIMLYKAQGVTMAIFAHLISTNSIFGNVVLFANLTKGMFFAALIVSISLSLIRSKTTKNRMTDVAAWIISVTACFSMTLFIIAVISLIFTRSFFDTFVIMGQIEGFSLLYLILPIASLVAVVLFTVSYINENLGTLAPKYFKIILPFVALLFVILSSVVGIFHL